MRGCIGRRKEIPEETSRSKYVEDLPLSAVAVIEDHLSLFQNEDIPIIFIVRAIDMLTRCTSMLGGLLRDLHHLHIRNALKNIYMRDVPSLFWIYWHSISIHGCQEQHTFGEELHSINSARKMRQFMTPKHIAIILGIVILAGAAWFLASPLFFDTVVDERLPVSPAGLTIEEERTVAEIEALTPEKVEAMPEAERMEKKQMMEDFNVIKNVT